MAREVKIKKKGMIHVHALIPASIHTSMHIHTGDDL
jgi:hypothetical protein